MLIPCKLVNVFYRVASYVANINGVLALTYPFSDVNIGRSNVKICYGNYPIRY